MIRKSIKGSRLEERITMHIIVSSLQSVKCKSHSLVNLSCWWLWSPMHTGSLVQVVLLAVNQQRGYIPWSNQYVSIYKSQLTKMFALFPPHDAFQSKCITQPHFPVRKCITQPKNTFTHSHSPQQLTHFNLMWWYLISFPLASFLPYSSSSLSSSLSLAILSSSSSSLWLVLQGTGTDMVTGVMTGIEAMTGTEAMTGIEAMTGTEDMTGTEVSWSLTLARVWGLNYAIVFLGLYIVEYVFFSWFSLFFGSYKDQSFVCYWFCFGLLWRVFTQCTSLWWNADVTYKIFCSHWISVVHLQCSFFRGLDFVCCIQMS